MQRSQNTKQTVGVWSITKLLGFFLIIVGLGITLYFRGGVLDEKTTLTFILALVIVLSTNEIIAKTLELWTIQRSLKEGFSVLDQVVGTVQELDICTAKNFTEGLDLLLADRKIINTMEIFAHTSIRYYSAISQRNNLKVKKLRLLLRNANDFDCMVFPSTHETDGDKEKEKVQQELANQIELWRNIPKTRISKVSLHLYPFEPLFHFIIINDDAMLFGLFQPVKKFPGVDVDKTSTYVVRALTSRGRTLIREFKTEFEIIVRDFAEEVFENP